MIMALHEEETLTSAIGCRSDTVATRGLLSATAGLRHGFIGACSGGQQQHGRREGWRRERRDQAPVEVARGQ